MIPWYNSGWPQIKVWAQQKQRFLRQTVPTVHTIYEECTGFLDKIPWLFIQVLQQIHTHTQTLVIIISTISLLIKSKSKMMQTDENSLMALPSPPFNFIDLWKGAKYTESSETPTSDGSVYFTSPWSNEGIHFEINAYWISSELNKSVAIILAANVQSILKCEDNSICPDPQNGIFIWVVHLLCGWLSPTSWKPPESQRSVRRLNRVQSVASVTFLFMALQPIDDYIYLAHL